jgi:hypothetical protein
MLGQSEELDHHVSAAATSMHVQKSIEEATIAYCANAIVWGFPAAHLSYDQWWIRLERVVQTGVEGAKKDIIHS